MRALVCNELVGPAGLRVEEIADPGPELAPGQVLIDVAAAAVNFPDVLLSYGKYQFKPAPPFVPGGEASGVVRAVGSGVTSVAPGDRVATFLIHGAFAQRVSVSEQAVIKVPDGVSFEAAAGTLVTYLTTLHALEDRAALKAGETLLVLGAAGGVGVAAVQLGKLMGARVIAAASTDEKVEFCKSQGADFGICYSREDLKDRVKALTSGTGVNVIYDPVGGSYSEAALRAIAWEGRHLVIGFTAGEIPKIPLNLTLLKGCQIVGVFWGQFAMRDWRKNRAHGERIFAWMKEGKLSPHIDSVLPLAQGGEALSRLERRDVKGKIILIP